MKYTYLFKSTIIFLCAYSAGVIAMEPVRDLVSYEGRQLLVKEIRDFANGDVNTLLTAVRKQDSVSNEDLTRDLYALVRSTCLLSKDLNERQLCVNYFLDKAAQPAGYLRTLALRFLEEFNHNDFSFDSHKKIVGLYKGEPEPELIRITGIAGVEELKSRLEKIASNPFAKQSTALKVDLSWQATMALARMGDDASAIRLRTRITEESDIVTRASLLFRDLGYTRHPISHQVLVHFLDSTERLPTLKPEQQEGEREAVYAAREITIYLEGSPDISALSNENEIIAILKNWLDKNKGLEFKR